MIIVFFCFMIIIGVGFVFVAEEVYTIKESIRNILTWKVHIYDDVNIVNIGRHITGIEKYLKVEPTCKYQSSPIIIYKKRGK